MSKETNLNDLTYQVELLQENVGFLTNAIETTDDFNGWNIADSSANIANALVKANTLEKAKQKAKIKKEEAKMFKKFIKAADLLGLTRGDYELNFIGEDGDKCLLTSLQEDRGFTEAEAHGWVKGFTNFNK